MPQVIYTRRAAARLDEIFTFLDAQDQEIAESAVEAILLGVELLAAHPFAGRLAYDLEPDFRELVIPFGGSGYVILYTVVKDRVVILSVRHQKEAGYDD